jgi:hypothetical protein
MNVGSVLKRVRWPIAGLGLGTSANLAFLSPALRHRLRGTILLSVATGVVLVFVVLGLDHLFFASISLERIRAIGALSVPRRIGIVVVSSIGEEAIFRLGVSTLVANLAFLALRRRTQRAVQLSIWLGIGVASVLFGLAHVGNAPNAAHPLVRALTLDGLIALVLGWLYWYRGLESAVVAHLTGDVTVYLALANLL